MSLLDLVTGCWAIAPDALREIRAIYATHLRGEKIDVAAIEARLGRPLHAEQPSHTIEAGGVAVIEAYGVIAPKANLMMQMSGGISGQQLRAQIEACAADPSVRSIVLALDSPGGNVLGVPEVAQALAAASSRKPTAVHASEQLASAGYWIGAAANSVYVAGPLVQVGSIGVVVSRTFDPTASREEETITAGKYKRLVEAKKPLSADSRAIVQADVDYVYSIFVDDVARYRGATSSQVLEHMADGRVFRGQQAIDAGLVDGVSTLSELVDLMATKPERFAARRKARIAALSGPSKVTGAGAAPAASLQSTGAGAALEDEFSQPQGINMPDAITRESLQADHAPLYAAILAEGAQAEMARAASVRAQLVPGHEALVEGLANDGKTTAAEAAMAVNAAVRNATTAAAKAHTADAPEAVAASAAPTDVVVKKTKAEQTAEAKAYAAANGMDFLAACKKLGFVA